MKTEIMSIKCNNSFRCWECTKDCGIKLLFLCPNEDFLHSLHEMFKINAGMLISQGYSLKEAEEAQKIITLTLYTTRMKFLQNL